MSAIGFRQCMSWLFDPQPARLTCRIRFVELDDHRMETWLDFRQGDVTVSIATLKLSFEDRKARIESILYELVVLPRQKRPDSLYGLADAHVELEMKGQDMTPKGYSPMHDAVLALANKQMLRLDAATMVIRRLKLNYIRKKRRILTQKLPFELAHYVCRFLDC